MGWAVLFFGALVDWVAMDLSMLSSSGIDLCEVRVLSTRMLLCQC